MDSPSCMCARVSEVLTTDCGLSFIAKMERYDVVSKIGEGVNICILKITIISYVKYGVCFCV